MRWTALIPVGCVTVRSPVVPRYRICPAVNVLVSTLFNVPAIITVIAAASAADSVATAMTSALLKSVLSARDTSGSPAAAPEM